MDFAPYKSLLINLLVKEAVKYLVTKLPFLSFGPFSWILSKILGHYFEKIVVATIKYIEIGLEKNEHEELVKSIGDSIANYEKETDSVKREEIENQIVNDARALIRITKLQSSAA